MQQKEILTYTLNIDSIKIYSDTPQDTIPVSAMQGNCFFIHKDLVISPPSPIKLNSFKHYITTLSQWKKTS